jgi:hypothetical protein
MEDFTVRNPTLVGLPGRGPAHERLSTLLTFTRGAVAFRKEIQRLIALTPRGRAD